MPKKKSKKEKEEEKDLEELEEELEEDSEDEDEESSSFLSNPKVIYGFIIVAVLAFVAWQVKGYFVAAMVNNKPISRFTVIEELEAQYGQDVLESLITRELVKQAAAEKGITVSEEEIDSQIQEISAAFEQQGSSLEDQLASEGETTESLREGVKLTIMVEKLFRDDINVTDDDVKEYYEQNQSLYPEDTDFDSIKGRLREQMIQQQLSGKFNQWLETQKEQATIRRFVEY